MSNAPEKKISCPLCKKPKSDEFAPFCSAGCKDRDLLQWLDEGYRVPGPVAMVDEDDPAFFSDDGEG